MKKIFLLLCLSVVSFLVMGQGKPRNQVGVSIGWHNFKFLDQHASPLEYGTNSLFPQLGLYYSRETGNSMMNLRLSGTSGTINPSRFGARNYKTRWSEVDSFQYRVASQFLHINIQGDYFRKIKSTPGDKLNYWVGGSIDEAAFYADEVANTPWMLNVINLAPAFQLNYLPAMQHNLSIRVDLSVLGAITRPVYALFAKSAKDKNLPAYFKQGTHVATVDKFQKFNLQLEYQYRVARHFTAGASYRLKWMHYTLPKEIHALDKHFDINLSYTY